MKNKHVATMKEERLRMANEGRWNLIYTPVSSLGVVDCDTVSQAWALEQIEFDMVEGPCLLSY